MTTPTREQVIQWAKSSGNWDGVAAEMNDVGLMHFAAIAHAAGRAQGLGEAVEVCKEEAKGFGGVAAGPFATDFGKHTHNAMAAGAETCAAAIEQLKGKQ